MKTAVIILNWNGEKLLEQFLPSIIQYSNGAEIYIADNASTDNSIDFIRNNYSTATIIKNSTNGGYAKGYNDALKQIKADIYCLINSDVEVTKNWLTPILSVFEKEPNTAVIQPKILDFKNKDSFEYAGAAGGFIDKFGYPYCRGRLFDSLEKDLKQYNDTIEIFWATGACFFIRSEIFHKNEGFDENYFAHQEEIDLCWRIKNNGYSIKYVGESTIFHVGGATLNEGTPYKTYLNFRNNLLTLVKNLPSKSLIWIIFFRLCLDGVAGIKFATELKFKHTFAIIKAHFSFYKLAFKYLKKRNNLTQQKEYYKTKSIIWQYYILKKKTFNQIK